MKIWGKNGVFWFDFHSQNTEGFLDPSGSAGLLEFRLNAFERIHEINLIDITDVSIFECNPFKCQFLKKQKILKCSETKLCQNMKNIGFHEFFLANTVKLHQINSPADKPTSSNTHPTINSTLQVTLEIIRSRRLEVFC